MESPTIEQALRAILAEVTPFVRPYSTDSYLPEHLIEQAQQALAALQSKERDQKRDPQRVGFQKHREQKND